MCFSGVWVSLFQNVVPDVDRLLIYQRQSCQRGLMRRLWSNEAPWIWVILYDGRVEHPDLLTDPKQKPPTLCSEEQRFPARYPRHTRNIYNLFIFPSDFQRSLLYAQGVRRTNDTPVRPIKSRSIGNIAHFTRAAWEVQCGHDLGCRPRTPASVSAM